MLFDETSTPAKYLVLSFAGAIILGTILLALPFASADGTGTGILDALFTATSATCVTGLVVLDTGGHFSTFGQAVILILIQLGGLGIMTYSVFIGIALGMGVGLWQRQILKDSFGTQYTGKVGGLVVRIILLVVAVEAIGTLLMFFHWRGIAGSTSGALWLSVFHSVSAFCNAGFSTFSNSLENYRGDLYINTVFMFLIIAGGLGFVVIFELAGYAANRKKRDPLSLHTRTVLISTGSLIVIGATLIYILESVHSLRGMGSFEGFMAAFFQSVTSRTAGFNTIPTGAISNSTLMVITALMFIGASPGGTGGGIKTTTAAIFLADFNSYMRGREPEMSKRCIERQLVEKAYIIIILSMALVTGATFALMVFEPHMDAMKLFFESVSAFGTVGLSTGITTQFGGLSKIVITITMFAGRVGPLTLALAMGGRASRGNYRYPEGKLFIG